MLDFDFREEEELYLLDTNKTSGGKDVKVFFFLMAIHNNFC